MTWAGMGSEHTLPWAPCCQLPDQACLHFIHAATWDLSNYLLCTEGHPRLKEKSFFPRSCHQRAETMLSDSKVVAHQGTEQRDPQTLLLAELIAELRR